MPHINVKPERTRVYETGEQAVNHVFTFGCHADQWDFGGASFAQTIEARRAITQAIRARDFNAFIASRRKGYWRIELKNDA